MVQNSFFIEWSIIQAMSWIVNYSNSKMFDNQMAFGYQTIYQGGQFN